MTSITPVIGPVSLNGTPTPVPEVEGTIFIQVSPGIWSSDFLPDQMEEEYRGLFDRKNIPELLVTQVGETLCIAVQAGDDRCFDWADDNVDVDTFEKVGFFPRYLPVHYFLDKSFKSTISIQTAGRTFALTLNMNPGYDDPVRDLLQDCLEQAGKTILRKQQKQVLTPKEEQRIRLLEQIKAHYFPKANFSVSSGRGTTNSCSLQ